jgi:hypothetical protein
MKVTFMDAGREAKNPPDPAYPDGMDVDISKGASKACLVQLPYPAPRCGGMMVVCEECGMSAYLTVAGRADDPRSVKLGCKLQ